jgi:hypothetical protein
MPERPLSLCCTVQLGFEFVVASRSPTGAEVSEVLRSARDSVVDTANRFSGVFSLSGLPGFVCVTDLPSRA